MGTFLFRRIYFKTFTQKLNSQSQFTKNIIEKSCIQLQIRGSKKIIKS